MIGKGCVVAVLVLVLAGCATAPHDVLVRHYTLPARAAVATRAAGAAAPAAGTLQVARINVPAWLAGTGLYYRLDYRNKAALASYARSDWAAPPAQMLAALLRDTLAAGGDWKAVVGPASTARAALVLHVDLDDFSQVFAAPGRSAGRLDATVTLLDGATGVVVAQRRFGIQVPASTADAVGGIAALRTASRRFALEVQRWLPSVLSRHPLWPSKRN